MTIKDLTEYEMRDILQRCHLGRLAYVLDGRPFVTPMSWVYSGGSLYSFTTVGQKVEAMRKQPSVSILFDAIAARDSWQSLLVHGDYKEISNESSSNVVELMQGSRAEWWEPAYVRTVKEDGAVRDLKPIYFRVDIASMTGHKAEKE